MSAENISYDLKRFAGIKRDYTPEEVERLRGSIKIEYSMCKHQSIKLWNLLMKCREDDIADVPIYMQRYFMNKGQIGESSTNLDSKSFEYISDDMLDIL